MGTLPQKRLAQQAARQPCLYFAGVQCEQAQQRHFLRIWNLKEAFCKAQGLGIITTMRHHTFQIVNSDRRQADCKHSEDNKIGSNSCHKALHSCQDPAWQVVLQPSCERAHLSVFDVDSEHTAAVCLLGPEGLRMGSLVDTPSVCHFSLDSLNGEVHDHVLPVQQTCC